MQVITSTIGIQKTRYDKGAVADDGIPESVFRTGKVALDKEANARVREIITEALASVVTYIAENSSLSIVPEEERPALVAGMLRNIEGFELCSGSGFTGELETELKADSAYDKYWVVKGEAAPSNNADAVDVEF